MIHRIHLLSVQCTALDRDLFDSAVADNDVGQTVELRARESDSVQTENLFVVSLSLLCTVDAADKELGDISRPGVTNERKGNSNTTKTKSHNNCCGAKLRDWVREIDIVL